MEEIKQMIPILFENIKYVSPVVESIANIVTANDCANIILASGGSPTMAEHPDEVEEIQSACHGLVLNLGNRKPEAHKAMKLAGITANQLGHPVILDPVGAGASKLRNDSVRDLCSSVQFTVIRGNISEMKAVELGNGHTLGVDANPLDMIGEENLLDAIEFAKRLSHKLKCVIAISGLIDIVANKDKVYVIRNGHSMMAKITGTGCMLTNVIGVFCSANSYQPLEATAAAIAAFAYCGELAYEKTLKTDGGTGSFRMYLMDFMSKMDAQTLLGGIKIERY